MGYLRAKCIKIYGTKVDVCMQITSLINPKHWDTHMPKYLISTPTSTLEWLQKFSYLIDCI